MTRLVVLRRHGAVDEPRRRVLFLHGMANSSSVWKPVVDAHEAELDCWTAELPWRGGGGPASWSHDEDTLAGIRSALSAVPGGVNVAVAHSFAAGLLLELLSRELAAGGDPFERYGLRGMILVSPFYRRRPEEFSWAALPDQLEDFTRTMEAGIAVQAGDRVSPELRREMARRICDWVGPYGWHRFVQTYMRTPWLRTELISLPTLVITGAGDPAALPAEGVALAEDLPGARLLPLTGCGHFAMTEQPGLFATAVRQFVGSFAEPVMEHSA